MLTAAVRAAQLLDGPYEAQADRFMWCTVCDVVIRHDHKNFAVSHMNCNSKHKACVGEAKKTPGAEDETPPECTTSLEEAELEVQLNANFTGGRDTYRESGSPFNAWVHEEVHNNFWCVALCC